MGERWEWVEIIEPRTKEHMYANLTTGECVWEPPPGVKIKRTDDNQWWELYDQNTSRFYYYNATSQKTVWHRPHNCDIIPLAKLQTLKQNTEVRDDEERRFLSAKKEISTQTPSKAPKREVRTGSVRSMGSQASPRTPKRHQHHQRTASDLARGGSARFDRVDQFINGERQHSRRGSQTSTGRRESLDSPRVGSRSRDHPRGASLEHGQHRVHSSERSHSDPHMSPPLSHRSREPSRGSTDIPPPSRVMTDSGRGTLEPSPLTRTEPLHTEEHSPLSRHDSGRGSIDSAISPPRQGSDAIVLSKHPFVHNTSSTTGSSMTEPPRRRFPRTNPTFAPGASRKGVSTATHNFRSVGKDVVPPDSDPYSVGHVTVTSHVMTSHNTQEMGTSTDTSSGMLQYRSDSGSFRSGHSDSDGQYRPSRSDSDGSYRPVRTDSETRHLHNLKEAITVQKGRSGSDTRVYVPNKYDRSDSDLSHSGSNTYRSPCFEHDEGKGAPAVRHVRELSDSSQGSYKPLDSHSSRGSLPNTSNDSPLHMSIDDADADLNNRINKANNENLCKISLDRDHNYLILGDNKELQLIHKPTKPTDNEVTDRKLSSESDKLHHSHERSNSEPDYACLVPPDNKEDYLEPISYQVHNIDPQTHRGDSNSMNSASPQNDHSSSVVLAGTPGSTRSGFSKNSSYTSDGPLERGFDDSDSSSVFSETSPPIRRGKIPVETQHASLKRKIRVEKQEAHMKPILEKSQSLSLQTDISPQRPLSLVVPSQSEINMAITSSSGSLCRQNSSLGKKPSSESDIENYAQKILLNKHKKGLFGKKIPVNNMLSWSKDPIMKPMLKTTDKSLKKDAIEVFKMVLMYMGDRKSKVVSDEVALEVAHKGWFTPLLRDEIFIQLCKQTTDNSKQESLQLGWELMAVCLTFFPPSNHFRSFLESYIEKHTDPALDTPKVPVSHFATICQRRLDRIVKSGAKKGSKKPTVDDIQQAKKSIFHPSMFGDTLEDIMLMQKSRFPDNKLPWIQTILSEEILTINGAQTEGIFRVPGDIDEVNSLKVKCDKWQAPSGCADPHIPASLLKLWYRELYEPVIPPDFYNMCVNSYSNPEEACSIIHKLPGINRLVFAYLIRFLQVFSAPENSDATKMDVSNLAMVMAPNCLRCESEDPRVIFENTRKEMAFMRTLIQHLDTSFMDGVV